jgi:hypothetical protein
MYNIDFPMVEYWENHLNQKAVARHKDIGNY